MKQAKSRIRTTTLVGWAVVAGAMAGCVDRSVVFVTSTKFGLDASQRQDQKVEVTLGYQRAEVASIPMCVPAKGSTGGQTASSSSMTCTEKNGYDSTGEWDAYSLVGAFHVDYGNPFDTSQPLTLRQVMATGMAARQIAKDPKLRPGFMVAAEQAVSAPQESTAPTPTLVPTAPTPTP